VDHSEPEDEVVGVTVVREDLRQLLVAAQMTRDELHMQGVNTERLALAIQHIGATASGSEWQPKHPPPEPSQ
jgi:hypothetical protein